MMADTSVASNNVIRKRKDMLENLNVGTVTEMHENGEVSSKSTTIKRKKTEELDLLRAPHPSTTCNSPSVDGGSLSSGLSIPSFSPTSPARSRLSQPSVELFSGQKRHGMHHNPQPHHNDYSLNFRKNIASGNNSGGSNYIVQRAKPTNIINKEKITKTKKPNNNKIQQQGVKEGGDAADPINRNTTTLAIAPLLVVAVSLSTIILFPSNAQAPTLFSLAIVMALLPIGILILPILSSAKPPATARWHPMCC